MPFTIVSKDITKMKVDAIVNAANTGLLMGGGVCGAIFSAAGASELQKACDEKAPIRTGEAAITPGFSLPAKYVIHAAGPVYSKWTPDESERLLRSAYTESLKLAEENDCRSIAFPLISSGIYGYPKDEALSVATSAIRDFLSDHEMDVYLAVFDKRTFVIKKDLLADIERHIKKYYGILCFECKSCIDEAFENMDAPFNEMLLGIIDEKGMKDSEVYKRANIDRKLFSKIRKGNGYIPRKRTVIALAIALRLSLEETDDFLKRAGYALSHSSKFDVIVEYFIINRMYDIYEINEVLFKYDQPLLGSGI